MKTELQQAADMIVDAKAVFMIAADRVALKIEAHDALSVALHKAKMDCDIAVAEKEAAYTALQQRLSFMEEFARQMQAKVEDYRPNSTL